MLLETEKRPDAEESEIRPGAELTVFQNAFGRVVKAISVPVQLKPEKPLLTDLPLTLTAEELKVRLDEFLMAAAHWNIKEILQALSDHFDHLQFRLIALGLSKSAVERDWRAKRNSMHQKLDPAQAAIHKAIETHGVAELRKALSAYAQAESQLASLRGWRQPFAISARRAKRSALQVIPDEVLRHQIAIEFFGGAIQTKFIPGSPGDDEIEAMKILQSVIDETTREEDDIREKMQAVERVRIDLESMKFPQPN